MGRSPSADVVIDCDGVSREHARLTVASDGVVHVLDLGSTNGTTINGELVSLRLLQDGERIEVGTNVLGVFDIDEPVRTGSTQF